MDYIIDPSWFYWISVSDALKIVFTIAFAITLGILVFLLLWMSIGADDEAEKVNIKKYIIIFGVAGVAFILGALFIPSKQVLIEMMIAKHITISSTQNIIEAIKDAVNSIIEVVNSIK